jgi:2-dehydro-3-deoxygluconokinase
MPKVVTFGEVLMRLSPSGQGRFLQADNYNICYAGSEANVAASLAYFGVDAAHVSTFPENDLGRAASAQLRRHGVQVDHCVFQEGRLGTYFFEGGVALRSPKIIYDRYDSAFAKLDPSAFDWSEILDGADWFHWSGITPAISAGAAQACLEAVTFARKNGITVSGDINYRRNLWQYGKSVKEIMPPLIEQCDLIIAGLTDLENCLGITESTLQAGCEKVVTAHPHIKRIATTSRATVDASRQSITGILWNAKGVIESRAYDISPIVDRVGAGDAFMAGLIYGFINNLPDPEVINFAAAACALKHTVEGDVNMCSATEVEALVKEENIGKLLR